MTKQQKRGLTIAAVGFVGSNVILRSGLLPTVQPGQIFSDEEQAVMYGGLATVLYGLWEFFR